MKKYIGLFMVACMTTIYAGCFESEESLTKVAQDIRLEAKTMGWVVGVTKSLTVAGIIKAKEELFPDGKVTVCIKHLDGDLKFSMRSDSVEEDGKQSWHFLTGSKTGWF